MRNQLEAERIHPSQGRDEFNNTTNEITDEFLQQVIHIGSRKEFDSYMKNIENSYYSQVKLPKSPYVDTSGRETTQLPTFPPRPVEQFGMNQNQDADMSFIDSFHELDYKRRRGQSVRNQEVALNLSCQNRQDQAAIQADGRQRFSYMQVADNAPYLQAQAATSGQAQTQRFPSPTAFDSQRPRSACRSEFQDNIEPPTMSTFKKFVAGSTRQERPGLAPPARARLANTNMPNTGAPEANDERYFDLTQDDAQFERQRFLLKGKYYNHNANSTPNQEAYAQTKYEIPKPFSYADIIKQQRDDMISSLKDPRLAGPAPYANEYPRQVNGPKTFSAGYSQSPAAQKQAHACSFAPGHCPTGAAPLLDPPKTKSQNYKDIYLKNTVTKEVIDQLGGIVDTVKPLEGSLQHHEMRKYQISQDYRAQMRGIGVYGKAPISPHSIKSSRTGAENARIVSMSPGRTSIDIGRSREPLKFDEDSGSDNGSDNNYALNDRDQRANLTISSPKGLPTKSPIKDDSEMMRTHRDQYLQSINDRRLYPGVDIAPLALSQMNESQDNQVLSPQQVQQNHRGHLRRMHEQSLAQFNSEQPKEPLLRPISPINGNSQPYVEVQNHIQQNYLSAQQLEVENDLKRGNQIASKFKEKSSILRNQCSAQLNKMAPVNNRQNFMSPPNVHRAQEQIETGQAKAPHGINMSDEEDANQE